MTRSMPTAKTRMEVVRTAVALLQVTMTLFVALRVFRVI